VEQDFQRALLVVVGLGSVMFGVGATALFLVFRGFGKPGAGKTRHLALMGGLIAFVMICCVILYFLAFLPRH
jgi:hypothetical protein